MEFICYYFFNFITNNVDKYVITSNMISNAYTIEYDTYVVLWRTGIICTQLAVVYMSVYIMQHTKGERILRNLIQFFLYVC